MVLLGVALAAAASLGFLWISGRAGTSKWSQIIGVTGFCVAFWLSQWFGVAPPEFPPIQSGDYLYWLLALPLITSVISILILKEAIWLGCLHRILLVGPFIALQLLSYYQYFWSLWISVAWTAGLVAAWLLLERSISGLKHWRWSDRWGMFFLMLLAVGASGLLVGTGSASLAQSAGMLAASTGAYWVGGRIFKLSGGIRLIGIPYSAVLFSLIMSGYLYSETPLFAALLFLVIPVSVGAIGFWRSRKKAVG